MIEENPSVRVSISCPEVGAYVEARCSRKIHTVWRVLGPENDRVSYADPYELGTYRKRPYGN